jgi:hypothetical protein
VEFLSAAPRPNGIQDPKSPATQPNRNFTRTRPDCFTCTKATRANPNRHSSESKDEYWVSNHRLGQFRISAPVTRSNPNPGSYSRCGPADLPLRKRPASSLRAMTAHLEGSVLRDRKALGLQLFQDRVFQGVSGMSRGPFPGCPGVCPGCSRGAPGVQKRTE